MYHMKKRVITIVTLAALLFGEIIGSTALVVRADQQEVTVETSAETILESGPEEEPSSAWTEGDEEDEGYTESEEILSSVESDETETVNETESETEIETETEVETVFETREETAAEPETETETETESEQDIDAGSASGKCGDNVTWTLSQEGILTLSGKGAMADYDTASVPWGANVSSIKQIKIGEGITSIGSFAFYNCYNLTEVIFPKSLTQIGEAAFYGCVSLTAVEIPEGVETLGEAVFVKCSNLNSITLKNGLKSIGNYAFQECASLVSLNVPASVTNVSWGDVFYNCGNMQRISVAPQNASFKSINNVIFSADGKTLLWCPSNWQGDSYSIPYGVKVIASYAFAWNKSLVSVDMPSSLTEIQEWAFYNSKLQSVVIPDSVKTVGYGIFDSCNELKEVVVGDGITEIPYRMFENCWALTNVTLGSGLKTIEGRAFCSCESLKSVNIPEGVTVIEGQAFWRCYALETVVFPSTLEEIWFRAFLGCSALKDFALPKNLKLIARQAFYGCTSLTNIVIPDSVEELGENIFENCSENLVVIYPDTLVEDGAGGYIQGTVLKVSGTRNYTYANQVLDIVNRERVAQGLGELTMDADLLEAAMVRAAEIHMYFSHTRPNGADCFSVCEKMSGENIAAGSRTPESVMQGWMNSPGHKANILTESFKSIGIGCFVQDGVIYWVQCFGNGTADSVSKTGSESVETDILVKSKNLLIHSSIDDVVTLCEGENLTIDIEAEFDDNDGWNDTVHVLSKSFTWKSSNPKAASVDAAGNVKYVGVGTTVISACIDGRMLKEWTVNTRKNIENSNVSAISDYTYSGKVCTPKIVLKTGNVQLREGQDYTVKYENNVEAGKGKAVISGTGNYGGQIISYFNINPVEVKDAKITYRGSRDYSLTTTEIMKNLSITANNRKLSVDDFRMTGAMYRSSSDGYILDEIYITYQGNYSGLDTIDVDIASMAMNGLRATGFGKNKVLLKWTTVPGADGYIICTQKKGVYQKIGYTTNTYYVDKDALDEEYNFYWVFPYAVDGKGRSNVGDYVKYVYGKGICPAVTNLKASSVAGGVKLSWTASADAEGYLIYGIVNGGDYGYVGMTTKGTMFIDRKASKTAYNFYWVFPYHKSATGKMIVGGTAPYTYGRAK